MEYRTISFLRDKEHCSGCGACGAACSFNAISIVVDDSGARYPHLDETLCKKCGKCEKVCHILHPAEKHQIIGDVLAVWAKDDKFRLNSSSGGVASVFTDYMLSRNQCVTGVVFDENFQAVMNLLESADEIKKVRGSKYVEVNTDGIFNAVSDALNHHIQVLFIGLPCHVAAIKTYIPHKLQDNLITVEIICHGVPAVKSWLSYLDGLKKRYSLFTDFVFRKLDAWGYCETLITPDGNFKIDKQLYLAAFKKNFLIRDNCFHCPYASKDRIADLTIGDFWYYPAPKNGGGVSYVSLNTEKGRVFFEKVQERFVINTDKWENAARDNGNLYKASGRPRGRDHSLQDWYDMPKHEFCKKYHLFPSFIETLISIPRRAMKKIFKYIR